MEKSGQSFQLEQIGNRTTMNRCLPILIKHRFNDFDAYTASLADWNLQFNQLDRGNFIADMEQIVTADVIIKRCHFNRRIEQLGSTASGFRTFGIPLPDNTPFNWRRHPIVSGNILSFAHDVEMNATSSPGFHLFVVSIKEGLLRAAAQRLGYESFEEILDREHVIKPSTSSLDQLRRICRSALRPKSLDPNVLLAISSALQRALPILLLEQFFTEDKNHPIPAQLARRRALRLAQEAIMDAEESILSLSELCRLTGEGERTLRYAFRECYGISPKAYLQAQRLNAVRRRLQEQHSSKRIVDAANSQGFWHMGQFAKDYQKMFGELPSETSPYRR